MPSLFSRPITPSPRRRLDPEPAPWDTPTPTTDVAPWEVPEHDPAQLDAGDHEESGGFFTLPNIVRIAGGVGGGVIGSVIPGAGTVAGAAAGGAIGAGLGEGIAELIEMRRGQRESINPWQVGTQAAIGAVPLGKLGTVAGGAIKGAGLGAGSTVATSLAETGELPGLEDVKRGALYGGAFGGVAGGVVGRFARPRALPDAAGPRPAPIAPPAGSRVRSAVAPRFTSFEPVRPPLPTDVDVEALPFAYQPALPMPGPRPGGLRTGAWEQGGNLPPLPDDFAEMSRIVQEAIAEREAQQAAGGSEFARPPAPSLTRPLLPSGLDPNAPTVEPGGVLPPLEPQTPAPWETTRPDINPSLARPLLPSGLDPNAPTIAPGGRRPPLDVAAPAEWDPTRPDVSPSLTRPLVASGLDVNPPAIAPTSEIPDWLRALTEEEPTPLVRGGEEPFPSRARPLLPSGLDANPPVLDAPFPPELEQVLDVRRPLEPAVDASGRPVGETPVGWTGPERRAAGRVEDDYLTDAQLAEMRARREASRAPKPPRENLSKPLLPSPLDELSPELLDALGGAETADDRLRYIGFNDPAAGERLAQAFADPARRGELNDLLRRLYGDEFDVYRGSVEEATGPASFTTRRQTAEDFAKLHGGTVRSYRARPEDVLFPGASKDAELVLDLARGRQPGGANVRPPAPIEGAGPRPTTPAAPEPVRQRPSITNFEVVDDAEARGPNASGESSASGEEMGRRREMANRGEKRVIYDRAGNKRDLLEGTDYVARPGETVGIEAADGSFRPVDDNGGRWQAAAARAQAASRPAPELPRQPVITRPGGPQIAEVDPAAVKVDAKTYQFKGGGDTQGVTDRLKGVEKWDEIAGEASPIIVHQRVDGSQYVVDGHQRLGLAKRLQDLGRPVPNLRAIVLDEAQGVSTAQARRIGAMLNLQQGTGSATDVAKVLREQALSSGERARIPKDQISGQKLRMGEDLAKLGDDAFLRVVNSQVAQNPARNEAFGAIVGRLVTGDAEQLSALKELAKAAPENAYEAEQFIKAIQSAGYDVGTQTNLFGSEEVATSMAAPIARVMASVRRILQSEKSALGNAVRNEGRLSAHGNVLNREANVAGAAEVGALDRLLDAYGHTTGPVREELKRVAAAVHRKELSPADAASDVIKALERERAAGSQPPVRPVVRPDDGPGGQPPPPAAEPPRAATVEEVPEDLTPTVPEASPEEAQSILQQLAKTMNVENNPQIVDDLPPAIQAALDRQKPPPALDFTQQPEAPAPTPEPRIGTRPYDPGANRPGAAIEWTDAPSGTTQSGTVIDQLPNGDLRVRRQDGKVRTVKPWEEPRTSAEESPGATLSAMLTRHDVRNPAKVKEIAASMKRVGWKGRPLLVVEDAGKETAWTGTHRLAAAREAGLSMEQVPQVRVSADKLRAAGYDVDELAALGKKKRVEALRKAGETEAADLLQEEIAAKAEREARPRPSPRAQGTSPRQQGTNPRAQAKTVADADRLLDEGNVDEAERLLSQQIEQRIQAALKHGTTPEKGGSTVYAGGFDPAAFRRLASKHPESAWKAVSSAIGGATGWYLDEDHPGRGILMGMAAGYGAGSMPRLVRALQQAEVSVGKGGRGGGVTPVRTARDASKDIGLFELVGGTPERTIPEQFEKARPAFEKFMRALHEEHRRTGQIIPQKRVQALRDRYVTPIITQIRKDAKVAQDAQHTYKARYITAFANRLAGHRTIGQRVVQAITKNKLPADFVERRIAGNVYYVGTGFALDTALQNTTQPLMALAHVPARYVVQAYRELASNPAAKRLVEGALLPLEKPADAIETTLGPFGSKLSKFRSSKVGRAVDPQNMLRWTDQKNREVVYYAARKFAEAKGLGTEAADQWARQVMRKTQAEPGALGTNPFHAGPVAGSLRPFTKYPTVFTEHLVDLLKQVGQGENLGGAARFAGSLAVLSLLGQQFGIDAEDLLISGGRPLGIDPQHPGRSLERLVSGMGTPATRGVSDVMKHITGGADHSLAEDLPDIAVPRYARKLKDAVTQFAGDKDVHITRGAGGKVRDVATPGETILNLLGLRTERQTERRHALADFYETATAASDSYKANRQQAYDRLGAALDAGDEEAARATIREIGSAAAVRSFLKRRNMLPEERFYRTLPPKVRQTVRGAFEEAQALAPEGAR